MPCLDYAVLSGATTETVHCVLRAVGGKQAYLVTFGVKSKHGSTANTPISILARFVKSETRLTISSSLSNMRLMFLNLGIL